MVSEALAQAPSEIGLAFACGNGRVTLVIVSGEERARLVESSPIVSDGAAAFRGELLTPAGFVSGFVTHGAYGVGLCEPDRSIALPAFRLDCPLDPRDAFAMVEIVTGSRDSPLMHLAARAMVRRNPDAATRYRIHEIAAVRYADSEDVGRGLWERLNLARERGGAGPLQLEGRQSLTNARLLVPYFDTSTNGAAREHDEIALGLLAGWDVSGTIRAGGIYGTSSESSADPGRAVAAMLASPLARHMLLAPELTRGAMAARPLRGGGLMTLVTTYALFDSPDHAADEAAVLAELNAARRARALPPLTNLPREPALDHALEEVATRSLASEQALEYALRDIARDRGRRVSGAVVETHDLQHLHFSGHLLARARRRNRGDALPSADGRLGAVRRHDRRVRGRRLITSPA